MKVKFNSECSAMNTETQKRKRQNIKVPMEPISLSLSICGIKCGFFTVFPLLTDQVQE